MFNFPQGTRKIRPVVGDIWGSCFLYEHPSNASPPGIHSIKIFALVVLSGLIAVVLGRVKSDLF